MLSVQEKIHLLMWDRRYLFIPSEISAPQRAVLIKDPTVEDRNYYLFVRRLEEQKNIDVEVPTEEQIFKSAEQANYWTEEDKRIIKEIDDHILLLKSEITNKKKFLSTRKRLEKQLAETEKLRNSTLTKQIELKCNSSEYLAHEVAVFSLMNRVVLDLNGNQFWKTDKEFLQDKSRYTDFISYIAHHVLTDGVWDIKEIREIARNPEWRLVWALNRENLKDLFNKPIGDLNINQKLVIYWSRIYDSALEDVQNRPDIDVINNDDQFDAWLANRDLERDEKQNNAKNKRNIKDHHEAGTLVQGEFIETCTCGAKKGKGLGESQKHDTTCLYGTFRYYNSEEKEQAINQVYGRNTKRTRGLLNKEQKVINQKGLIEEQHLRDQKSRKLMGYHTNIHRKYR